MSTLSEDDVRRAKEAIDVLSHRQVRLESHQLLVEVPVSERKQLKHFKLLNQHVGSQRGDKVIQRKRWSRSLIFKRNVGQEKYRSQSVNVAFGSIVLSV
jgi:hypothetical protein